MMLLSLLVDVTLQGIDLSEVSKPLPKDSPWRRILLHAGPVLFGVKWIWCWAFGHCCGAYSVRRWLLSLWPSIEFDFGLPHLKTEQMKRSRLVVVWTLIVVPILCSIIYDLMKARF